MARKPAGSRRSDPPRTKAAEQELALRIIMVRPPAGVRLCLQTGRDGQVAPAVGDGGDVPFDLTVRVIDSAGADAPRLLGPFVQGPPDGRFVYIRVGTLAGQADSPWTRRVKVPLGGITWALARAALGRPGARLEARIAGTARDGGPACASVPLLDGGWRVVT